MLGRAPLWSSIVGGSLLGGRPICWGFLQFVGGSSNLLAVPPICWGGSNLLGRGVQFVGGSQLSAIDFSQFRLRPAFFFGQFLDVEFSDDKVWGPRRVGPRRVAQRKSGAQKGGGPNLETVGPQRVGSPKFRAFFPSSRHNVLSAFSLLGSFRGILVVFEAVHVWSSRAVVCEPRRWDDAKKSLKRESPTCHAECFKPAKPQWLTTCWCLSLQQSQHAVKKFSTRKRVFRRRESALQPTSDIAREEADAPD